MRCCTIKLKRSWEYCPGCGEAIEWPRKLPPPQKWSDLDIELIRMSSEPVETVINRIRSRETEILAGYVPELEDKDVAV